MIDQYLMMDPTDDAAWQSFANEQPFRYRYTAVTGYTPSFDQYLPWKGPISPSCYRDILACYATPGSPGAPAVPNIQSNPNFVLRDINGNPLYLDWACLNGKCPQFCADPTNPDFQSFFINLQKQDAAKGYNLYIDDVNLRIVTTDGSGNIVAPAGVTLAKWCRGLVEFLETIRQSFPQQKIIHNVTWDDNTSPEYLARQIRSCDWANLERGFADPLLNAQTTMRLVTYMDLVHALGKRIIIENMTSKGPNGQDILDYLLGAYWVFFEEGDLFGVEDLHVNDSRLDIETGKPFTRVQTGPFTFSRPFQRGWAWVDLNAKTGGWTQSS